MHFLASLDNHNNLTDPADVIVIGAGLAGLTAARDLAEIGLTVLILEARERIGGRTYARQVSGTTATVDFGGTWVRPKEHPAIMAELARYHIGTEATPSPTRFITELSGATCDKAVLNERETDEISRAYGEIAEAADDLATTADALDNVVLDDNLRAWVTAAERFLSGAPLSDLSAIDSASIPPTDVADPDHYTHTVVGTTQSLVDALAADTDAKLMLGATVTRVCATADGFNITTTSGHTLSSAHVVVALPMNVLPDVEFEPGVPLAATLGVHAGRSVKLWMTVRKVEGWPRIFSATSPIAYARVQRRLDEETALLVGFADDPAMATATPEQLQAALRPFLPGIEVLAVDTHDWNTDAHALGTWMAPRPRQLKQATALSDPDNANGLHFAGADYCSDEYGTLEAAVVSGRQAAKKIESARKLRVDSH